jgi:molybdopterin-biosynthesis enzyme MoeA-like protein
MSVLNERSKSAVVTIGDEIVFGERRDENQQWMLEILCQKGVPASVAMSLPDEIETIAHWLGMLRQHHQRIFVSGGIGGTHDDHTREAIALALGGELQKHEQCYDLLSVKYGDRFNSQRQRMAWLPPGSELIANPIGAPGFVVEGIYAFPGFPAMLQPMLSAVLSDMLTANPKQGWLNREFVLPVAEGEIARQVEDFANQHPQARIGIYPSARRIGQEVMLRIRYAPERPELGETFERFVQELQKALPAKGHVPFKS